MGEISGIGIAVIAAVLVLLIFSIFKIPIKIVFRLIINTVAGLAALFVINLLGRFIGLSVAVNWINAVIVGVLGVPGVALVLLLQWLSYFS